MDEVSVLKQSNVLYENLFRDVREAFLELAILIYLEAWNRTGRKPRKHPKRKIDDDWVLDYLEEFDPVTKYVFTHEVDRKRSYFAESVIASSAGAVIEPRAITGTRKRVPTGGLRAGKGEQVPAYMEVSTSGGIAEKAKALDKAEKLWAGMINQYAINVTDKATVEAYADAGVEYVQWVTKHDKRVCKDCERLDGKIFPIANIPRKVHYGCRCELHPVKGPEK